MQDRIVLTHLHGMSIFAQRGGSREPGDPSTYIDDIERHYAPSESMAIISRGDDPRTCHPMLERNGPQLLTVCTYFGTWPPLSVSAFWAGE
jgi:hypothetical protein